MLSNSFRLQGHILTKIRQNYEGGEVYTTTCSVQYKKKEIFLPSKLYRYILHTFNGDWGVQMPPLPSQIHP